MDIRTLIDKDFRLCLVVPRNGYMDTPSHKVPLIAVVLTNDHWWTQERVSNSYWRFFRYGVECTWADLTDEQRWEVRTKTAWDGQVKDYWVELRYKDKRYYTLEALT